VTKRVAHDTGRSTAGTADTAGDPGAVHGTRERIVRAASALMQRQGYDGTGIKQISQEAGATLGSVYHFFPGGKQELAVAAVRRGDAEFGALLERILAADPDPGRALVTCTEELARRLRASDWAEGCPVTATATGSAGRYPDVQRAAAEALGRWQELVRRKLLGSGLAEPYAGDLASVVISTLEGAVLASQLTRDDRPLRLAGRFIARVIALHRAEPAEGPGRGDDTDGGPGDGDGDGTRSA
jgi:AcrR family transcriptional regulator